MTNSYTIAEVNGALEARPQTLESTAQFASLQREANAAGAVVGLGPRPVDGTLRTDTVQYVSAVLAKAQERGFSLSVDSLKWAMSGPDDQERLRQLIAYSTGIQSDLQTIRLRSAQRRVAQSRALGIVLTRPKIDWPLIIAGSAAVAFVGAAVYRVYSDTTKSA